MNRILLPAALLASIGQAQNPYGDPTPGTGSFEPRLSAAGPWIGNTAFDFDIRCALGSVPAFLVIAGAPTQLQIAGFTLLLDPATQIGAIFTLLGGAGAGQGSGSVPLPLTIPLVPQFIAAPFFAQAIMIDSGAPGGVFSATQGLRFELGLPPLVFVGCSVASGDAFQLISPFTGTIVDSGSPAQVDNCTAAVFARGGTRLFVASGINGTIGMADVSALPASWSTIFAGGGSCYGLALDPFAERLWTLTDPGTGTRELAAIDIDEQSPTFGQVVANTVGIAFGIYERWALSRSGRRAAMLTFLPGTLTIVDTDPGSATYLQNLVTAVPIPVDQPSPISLPTQVVLTPDDRYALVLIQQAGAMPGELARFDLATGQWVDHNGSMAGRQNMSPSSQPPIVLGSAPTSLEIAQDGTFAIVAGFGGCGWVGRLTLDPKNPQAFLWTPWAPAVSLENSWTAGLSADETEVGVGTWQSSCGALTGAQLARLDAVTGALLGTVAIPPNPNPGTLQNLYTVVYR